MTSIENRQVNRCFLPSLERETFPQNSAGQNGYSVSIGAKIPFIQQLCAQTHHREDQVHNRKDRAHYWKDWVQHCKSRAHHRES